MGSILLGVCSFAATVARRQWDGRSFRGLQHGKEAWPVEGGNGVHKPHMQRSTSTFLCFVFSSNPYPNHTAAWGMYDKWEEKLKK